MLELDGVDSRITKWLDLVRLGLDGIRMTRLQQKLWALGAELWCSANYHVAREDCLVGFFGRLDNILGASVKIVVSSLWAPEERCPQFGGSSSPYFRSSFVERQNIGQLCMLVDLIMLDLH